MMILSAPIRPASIFLESAGAISAGLVEKVLTNILPDGMWPVIFDGIGLLNFDRAKAVHASLWLTGSGATVHTGGFSLMPGIPKTLGAGYYSYLPATP